MKSMVRCGKPLNLLAQPSKPFDMQITKTVGEYLLGHGALGHLDQLLTDRTGLNGSVIYFIDHFFADGILAASLPRSPFDEVVYVDTTEEPTTEQVDQLLAKVSVVARPAAVVGIGGGSTMDVAKAVSNLLTNGGMAADYQGWDLVKVPGVFKIGIPTISGTGAEASRTCVMLNRAMNLKLGMNSKYTLFDRVLLDPDLTDTVPRNQYFYTGMDCYIHCIESLAGRYRHPLADAFSQQALAMCREVFLRGEMQAEENREKLMAASFLGGSAIGNSYVGLVHPFSAALSVVFHTHHCVGNCIALSALEEFYPRETDEFNRMMDIQRISLPRRLCHDLSPRQEEALYKATIIHEKPLANALGEGFKKILSFDKVVEIFRRM
jgi:3-deoxy-alpha-D-manno-octulosonate 8-oxidase